MCFLSKRLRSFMWAETVMCVWNEWLPRISIARLTALSGDWTCNANRSALLLVGLPLFLTFPQLSSLCISSRQLELCALRILHECVCVCLCVPAVWTVLVWHQRQGITAGYSLVCRRVSAVTDVRWRRVPGRDTQITFDQKPLLFSIMKICNNLLLCY